MATFIDPVDAVKAAVDMIKELDEFNKSISQELILKIGIHRGHSIVVTVNERLDYFGQTVNIAARVQALSDADEIVVSDDAFLAPGMDAVVGACEVTAQTVAVKGVSSKLAVHKIRVRK
jgi:class 3 adenylate cyclase